MDGIDYSKALSRERDQYYKNLNAARDSHDRDIAKMEDTHKYVEKNQAENFHQQKKELEAATEAELTKSRDKTQAAIRERTEDLKSKLRQEKEEFAVEKERNKVDFDKRLDDLKGNYQRAFKESENRHTAVEDMAKDKYEQNRAFQEDRHDKEIQYNNHEGRIAAEKSQIKMRKDKSDLITKQQNDLETLTRDETKRRLDQASDFREQLDTLDSIRKQENANLNKHYSRGNKLHHEKADLKILAQQNNYQHLDQEMREKSARDKAFISKTHKNELREQDINHAKEKEILQLKLNRLNGERGADELNQIILEANDNKNDLKLKNVQNQMSDFKEKMQMQEEFNRLKAQSDYKQKGSEYSLNLSQNEKQFNELLSERQSAARKDFSTTLDRFEKNEMDLKNDSEKRVKAAENNDKKHTHEIRNEMIMSLNRAKEDNMNSMSELRKEFDKDRIEYKENTLKQNNSILTDLRAGLNNKIDNTVERYEGRLKNHTEKTQSIVEDYEQKLAKMQERFDAALGYQQELSDKKEEEYRNVMRSRLMTKDAENKKNVEIIRDDQKKAMQRAVHENNAKLAQMTNYYEDKLSRLEVDLGREMNRQANEIKRENERKKIDTELKIHGIVQRYESIIDKLKDDLSDKQLASSLNKRA